VASSPQLPLADDLFLTAHDTVKGKSLLTPATLGLGLAALGIILWALHRRKAGAQAWGRSTADLNRRALVALDDVVAQGSVVTGKIEALASEARALESSAPDDPSRAAAANVRARLDELASTMQSDRALRLGSPPPTDAQLTYSTAVIRQQAQQLQGVLRPPAAADAALS